MNKRNWQLYIGGSLVILFVLLAIVGPFIAPHTPDDRLNVEYIETDEGAKVIAPPLKPFEVKSYLLGTTMWGADLLSLILYGLRFTLFISLIVAILRMILGSIIGMYVGVLKKQPFMLVSFERSFSYFPQILIVFFLLAPVSLIPEGKPNVLTLTIYFIIISTIVGMPSIISSIRQKSKEIYKKQYIESAKILGASKHRIVWKHIFPQLKESIMIAVLLEVVYTITLMGQLAIFNVFVGGTIIQFDPLIFLSTTNEIAGLVGQARGHIFGYQYVLFVLLFTLLMLTVSFSLLANGLKNRFATMYKKHSWIQQSNQMIHFHQLKKITSNVKKRKVI